MNIFSTFVSDYDRMINWEKRLQNETPFYKKIFLDYGAKRVLDVGCATGRHALLFSSWGMNASGADPSDKMISTAKENAKERDYKADFRLAEFEDIDKVFEPYFDVIMCMGNSLPHILNKEGLDRSFKAAKSLLNSKGILLLQLRNYTRVYEKNEKFMPLNSITEDGKEYLYLRFNELMQDAVNFNIVTLTREQDGQWSYNVNSEELRPWKLKELSEILEASGLSIEAVYGDFKFNPYNGTSSKDLILIAKN